MGDVSESNRHIEKKVPLRKKRDYTKMSKQKMIEYYNSPEKQQKLRTRIKDYEEHSIALQLKANDLKQFLIPENQTQVNSVADISE